MRWIIILFVSSASFLMAKGEQPSHTFTPLQTQTFTPLQVPLQASVPNNLLWNKWDTDNFIVLSIDKNQGIYLKNNIESLKSNLEKKWGMESSNLSRPCKLLCVPDEKMLNRLFSIEKARAEAKSEGDLDYSVIWFDFEYLSEISHLLSKVILEDSSNSLFIKKGIQELERPLQDVRSIFSESTTIDFQQILSTTNESFNKMKNEEKKKFVNSSALVCLLLRRELGIRSFSLFVNSKQDENSFKSIFGYKDIESFSETATRYSENLSEDIKSNRTPDKYLKWEEN